MEAYVVYVVTASVGGMFNTVTSVIGVGNSLEAAKRVCNKHLIARAKGIKTVELEFEPEQKFGADKPYNTGAYISVVSMYTISYRIEPFEMAEDDHA